MFPTWIGSTWRAACATRTTASTWSRVRRVLAADGDSPSRPWHGCDRILPMWALPLITGVVGVLVGRQLGQAEARRSSAGYAGRDLYATGMVSPSSVVDYKNSLASQIHDVATTSERRAPAPRRLHGEVLGRLLASLARLLRQDPGLARRLRPADGSRGLRTRATHVARVGFVGTDRRHGLGALRGRPLSGRRSQASVGSHVGRRSIARRRVPQGRMSTSPSSTPASVNI